MEELEASNLRYKCEFPGCEREYGKRQHLKEHFRKHTGEMRYSCEVKLLKYYLGTTSEFGQVSRRGCGGRSKKINEH